MFKILWVFYVSKILEMGDTVSPRTPLYWPPHLLCP